VSSGTLRWYRHLFSFLALKGWRWLRVLQRRYLDLIGRTADQQLALHDHERDRRQQHTNG
jgi:hypothetical protein